MLGPALADDGQHDTAFDFAHALFADALFTLIVDEVCVRQNFLHDLVASNLGAVSSVFSEVVHGDGDGVHLLEGAPELVEVPVLGVAFSDARVDDGGQHLVHEARNLFLQVVTVQDAAAVLVDRFALAVEHVVILEHVLTLFSVTAFNV